MDLDDLPPRVYVHHGRYVFLEDLPTRNPVSGKPMQRQHSLTRVEEGKSAMLKALADIPHLVYNPWKGWGQAIYMACRHRASGRGIAFTIEEKDFKEMVMRTNGRCQLTGLRFILEKCTRERLSPWSPSVDRIDSGKGYELGNCRIVCLGVNIALNSWGDEALIKMAKALVNAKRRQSKLSQKLST